MPDFIMLNNESIKIKAQNSSDYRTIGRLLENISVAHIDNPDEPLSKLEYFTHKMKETINY